MKYPAQLEKILKDAPVAFGIIAILDFRKGKPISTIQKEWDLLKATSKT
jgi:hypothetical protein